MAIKLDHIKLVDIVSEPNPYTKKDAWRVTMIYSPIGMHALTATWYLDKADFDESALIPVARNWFHRLCSELGEATTEWRMDEDKYEAQKRPQAKPRSSGTARKT